MCNSAAAAAITTAIVTVAVTVTVAVEKAAAVEREHLLGHLSQGGVDELDIRHT
jgi:hypothetical protein